MRLFIAIEIPEEVKKEMAKAQEQLKRDGAVDAGWTRPEGIHLTLKFLGDVPETKLPEIMNALEGSVANAGKIRLEVGGVGTFPAPRNARVVWIGVSGEIEKLEALQTAVDGAMTGLGFEQDERKFTAHLTLGRIKYIRSREAWLKSLDSVKDIRLTAFDVATVSLMKSELKPSGAVYAELGRINLK